MDLFTGGDGAQSGGGRIETVKLHEATSERYLNYALSVITSRALPDVRDGLKPVQRRILYGMYHDLRLRKDTRYLKSARVVGDVMGKYHPHGDSSIYDAMVRMAQSFALRYPMVDGQGNFGSIDGDSAAAMRYTEARIQAIAEELLGEIGQDTVQFRPTYDGQLTEPVVLPAQVPNLLINGATGIAVGMATNIPPHNLPEVIRALVRLIDEPEADLGVVLEYIKAPDFPTGGEILSTREEIAAVYAKGQGPIKLRGQFEVELINRKRYVIVTSIPYMLNKATLVEKIADLIITKKVPQIVDVRDESTDDVRIVMELKRGANPDAAMAYLYKHTPLQQNFHVNLTCLLPTENPLVSAPARVSLLEMLRYFLDFRLEVVTRRIEHRLANVRKRIHRLEAFEKVFDVLDEIIRIIRASEGKADAARKIIKRLKLDAEQVDAILELRLYRLAKLEILKIQQELGELRAEAELLEGQLGDEASRWQLVRGELIELAECYGDPRRTKIVGPAVESNFAPEAYIVREKAWVIVTRNGRIKRQKGFSDLSAIRVPDGDEVGWALRTNTRHTVALYTQYGRAYVVRVADITATTGYGDPLQALFNFSDGERVVGVTSSDPQLHPFVTEAEVQGALFGGDGAGEAGEITPAPAVSETESPPPHAISVSQKGKISRFCVASHFEVSNKSGRRFMSLVSGDEVVAVLRSRGDENVCLATRGGRVTVFEVHQIPAKSSAVRGVNAIRLDPRDEVLGFTLAQKKREGLVCHTNRGRELIVRETSYKPVKRGGKGMVVIRLGKLVSCEWPALVYEPEREVEEPTDGTGEGDLE